ncbi:MAG: HlyD family type I secretion periplasmic adaptor subunit [Gammaproteobacteria bacterium]|jgi:HlyD family type I secretion membrane fusion protein|nr:HlyD family type I secretion periplasmic adaptor subunit [Gammaproteobacteria bacterium]
MQPQARPIIRFGLAVVFVTFVVLGGWAVLAPLHGAVIAVGLVKVESYRKTVQHQEGGIVKEILVRDGVRVAQGQPLILLQDVTVDASLGLLRETLQAELVRHARLSAEQEGRDGFALPEELADLREERTVKDALAKETLVFDTHKASLDGKLALMEQQVGEIEAEHAALEQQIAAAAEAIRLAEEELQVNDSLRKKAFVANTQVLALRRAVAEYRSQYSEYLAERTKAQQRKTDLKLRMLQTRSDFEQVATEDLKQSTSRIAELRERIRPSEDAVRRQIITAPIAGRVVDLRVHTVGATIGPREPLMDVVPDDTPLIVEARTHVDAIDQLHVDQAAEIRFTTFNSRTTPLVKGTLTYISPDALADEKGNPFFQLHVAPDPESLAHAGIERLAPGMQAEVFVQTTARTLVDYLVSPILDTARRAMRER